MAAVVTKENPKTIFILHNLETNESAPYHEDNEDYTNYYPRRDKMLNEFNNDKYEYQFQKN